MKKYPRGTSLDYYCKNEGLEFILEQFDFEKNKPKTPVDYCKSSDKKVWFSYQCGHSKPQRIADKVNKRSEKCPICENRGGIGKSLQSEYPKYAKYFNEERNEISACDVSAKNGNMYWWKCIYCKNEWEARVADVVTGHSVCANCSNHKRSIAEYILAYYLRKIDPDILLNYRIDQYKFDFISLKYNLAIEYDGYPWHDNAIAKLNDIIKDKIIIDKKTDMKIFRFRDSQLDKYEGTAIVFDYHFDGKYKYLHKFQEELATIIGNDATLMDIDVQRDSEDINKFKKNLISQECILNDVPNIREYLDEKFVNMDPEDVSAKTRKIIFNLRDPEFKDLTWKMTAYRIWRGKSVYTQKIDMCMKMYNRYPELKDQILLVKDNMTENTTFSFKCKKCGKLEKYNYVQLRDGNKRELCSKCLSEFRLSNINSYRYKKVENK